MIEADTVSINKFLELQSNTSTISGGTLYVTKSMHLIETEGGAALDTIKTIHGGTNDAGITNVQTILVLRSADDAHDVFFDNIPDFSH